MSENEEDGYIVVQGYGTGIPANLELFVKQINKLIEDGYSPVGGIAVSVDVQANTVYVIQATYKPSGKMVYA